MPGAYAAAHARRIEFPSTLICSAGSGFGAGPASTEPSAMRYLLPWHGQSMVPFATVPTVQPWWVQIAEKALNSSFFGCVTTIFWSLKILPPPTGISDVFANSWPPDAFTDDDPEESLLSPYLLHPAVSAAAAPVTRTVRRVELSVMWSLRKWSAWGPCDG